MNDDRAQLVERLRQANNVLITVNNNPTVDQLAACIGFTILLNKLNKHATAVFSGEIPSTLEFLKPEDTLEKNTDSLRDFIIALDKSKADKLRYKVEDTTVKIFITPYKTSISDADLEFSQGDFNVDVVLALGIHEREQVDKAIMGHGRILHDAVIMSADTKIGSNIGTINWVNEQASSLCEMLASLTEEIQPQSLDAQIATALLTGIVSETERFSNQKTSSSTMEVSSRLMAAGADQQLVASKLEAEELKVPVEQPKLEVKEEVDDGSIVIDHTDDPEPVKETPEPEQAQEEIQPPPFVPADGEPSTQVDIDDYEKPEEAVEPAVLDTQEPPDQDAIKGSTQNTRLVVEPPKMGGTLTANSNPEPLDPSTDPLSVATSRDDSSILTHSNDSSPSLGPSSTTNLSDIMAQSSSLPINDNQTLEEIEETVNGKATEDRSIDTNAASTAPLVEDDKTIADIEVAAREAIDDAINSQPDSELTQPIAGLNAQPIDLNIGHEEFKTNDSSTAEQTKASDSQSPYLETPTQDDLTGNNLADAPPPVPPPMTPPFNSSSTPSPQE